jgi:hypothetical protein
MNINRHIKQFVLLIGILALAFTACEDFYEEPIMSDITEEIIFSDTLKAIGVLNSAYFIVPYYFPEGGKDKDGIRKTMRLGYNLTASVTDEGISSINWSGAFKRYYNNSIDPLTVGKDGPESGMQEFVFEEPYYYIRKLYNYLDNVNTIPGASEGFIRQTSAEANLLIAMAYFELMKRYGSVPLVDHVIGANEIVDETRPELSTMISFIDGQITKALPDLPVRWPEYYRMRVNRGSAYFLRSRLWLWAASPLFNTSTPYIDNGDLNKCICLGTDNDPALWEKAAQYAKEAIVFCEANGYALVDTDDPEADYTLATRDLPNNTEVVLASRRHQNANQGDPFYFRSLPPRETRASQGCASVCPTQNFVDMYETIDGSEVDYASANPWTKLDPRFHASIIHDKAAFGAGIIGIMHKNDPLADNTDKYNAEWVSGYFMRKFFHSEHYLKSNKSLSFDLVCMVMRLPELYFNYAEALNEYSPGHPDIMTYLNKTRIRAHMSPITANGQHEVREAIRKEKAIEFAFEDHRFFDLRRWLRGDLITQKKLGVKRAAGGGYVIVDAPQDRQYFDYKWDDKFYLLPFPEYEIQKAKGLTQNPGY